MEKMMTTNQERAHRLEQLLSLPTIPEKCYPPLPHTSAKTHRSRQKVQHHKTSEAAYSPE